MSCKVNTEITGGYGDGEENNESLNPEDLEQSVIMDMQDDNDRYKLYIHIILNTFFATNPNFLIHISLKPAGENLIF